MNRLYYEIKYLTGLLIILLFLITSCSATTQSVIREMYTVSDGDGDVSHVTLQIQGFDMGGIIETLPSGMTFQSSSMPENQVSVTGNSVIFAVINETKVEYSVKKTNGDETRISGKWEDIRTGQSGDVIPSGLAGTSKTTESASGSASSPGFIAITTIFALIGVFLVIRRNEP